MDERTLTALKASIAKWERNAAITDIDKATMGVTECPLCALFWNKRDTGTPKVDCTGCPVQAATGRHGCAETPYDAAELAEQEEDLDGYLDAAQAELDFLRSLLPPQPAMGGRDETD